MYVLNTVILSTFTLDGRVNVSVSGAEPIECILPGMAENPPKFLEMKSTDSERKEIVVYYDCDE